MQCNNLIDRINYVNKEIISKRIDLIDYERKSELMLEYCETQCNQEFCTNYRSRTGQLEQLSN